MCGCWWIRDLLLLSCCSCTVALQLAADTMIDRQSNTFYLCFFLFCTSVYFVKFDVIRVLWTYFFFPFSIFCIQYFFFSKVKVLMLTENETNSWLSWENFFTYILYFRICGYRSGRLGASTWDKLALVFVAQTFGTEGKFRTSFFFSHRPTLLNNNELPRERRREGKKKQREREKAHD